MKKMNSVAVILSCILFFMTVLVNAQTPWNLGGNTVGGNTHIGTSDAYDFPVYTNDTQRAIISVNGNVGIGKVDGSGKQPLYPRNKLLIENGNNFPYPYDLYSFLHFPDPNGFGDVIKPGDIGIASVSNVDPNDTNTTGKNLCYFAFAHGEDDNSLRRGYMTIIAGHGENNNGGFNALVVGNTMNGHNPTNTGFGCEVIGGGASNVGFEAYVSGYEDAANNNKGVSVGITDAASGSSNTGIAADIEESGTGSTNTGLHTNITGNGSNNTGVFVGIEDGGGSTNTCGLFSLNAATSNINTGIFTLVSGSTNSNLGYNTSVHGTGSSNTGVQCVVDSGANNFGVYAEAGNGTTSNIGVNAHVKGTNSGLCTGVLGALESGADGDNNYGIEGDLSAGNAESENTYYAVLGIAPSGSGSGSSTSISNTPSTNQYAGYFQGDLYCSDTYYTSDPALKDNIKDYKGALDQLAKLPVKKYTFKTTQYPYMCLPAGERIGVLSTDLKAVFPNLVKRSKSVPIGKSKEGVEFDAVNYNGLIPVMIKATQEVNDKTEALVKEKKELETKVAEQQDAIKSLNDKLDALSNCINELCSRGSLDNTGSSSDANQTQLFQSTPNPTSGDAKIGYYIANDFSSAAILFTDMNGITVQQYRIDATGAGSISVSTNQLVAGTYKYTLLIDGKATATKTMTVVKN